MKRKRVAILGSTGSIGVNTLDVIKRHSDRFEVVALAAHNNVNVLADQIKRFRPRYAAIGESKMNDLRRLCGGRMAARLLKACDEDIAGMASAKDVDIVVLAMSGAAALAPFMSAVKAGKVVAPANKEALVMAGEMIMTAADKHGARVIPVDSEQSAIFQCLEGQRRDLLKTVHLTASGGVLRTIPAARHDRYSVKEILSHPRWNMGRKITVDSATLMNKGFEVIEAMRLFRLTVDQIKVVIHPEAIVHSMVEFIDGSFLAQLGVTDMRLPIQYALSYPQRLDSGLKGLDLSAVGNLRFEAPDLRAFPSLALAFDVARRGGTAPAVLNAADEVAVEAFLCRKIRISQIYKVVSRTLAKHKVVKPRSLDDILQADRWAREEAQKILQGRL